MSAMTVGWKFDTGNVVKCSERVCLIYGFREALRAGSYIIKQVRR